MTSLLGLIPLALKLLVSSIPFVKCMVCPDSSEYGVCTIPRGGMTTLQNATCDKRKFKTIMIDLDALVKGSLTEQEKALVQSYTAVGDENSLSNLLLPKLREIKEQCIKNYPKKRIIYFSTDISVLNHLNIKNIISFLPSRNLYNEIISQNENMSDIIQGRKYEITQSDSKIYTYDSFTDLSKVFIEIFKLKMKM